MAKEVFKGQNPFKEPAQIIRIFLSLVFLCVIAYFAVFSLKDSFFIIAALAFCALVVLIGSYGIHRGIITTYAVTEDKIIVSPERWERWIIDRKSPILLSEISGVEVYKNPAFGAKRLDLLLEGHTRVGLGTFNELSPGAEIVIIYSDKKSTALKVAYLLTPENPSGFADYLKRRLGNR